MPALLVGAVLAMAGPLVLAQDKAAAPAAAASGPSVRAEMAAPLRAAQQALQASQFPQALQQLAEAEKLPNPSPYESYLIRRLKATALYGAGQHAEALAMFEVLVDDPQLPASDQRLIAETAIKLAVQLKDYPRAAARMKKYLDGGGPDPEVRRLYPQVLYAAGDNAGAASVLQAQVAAEEAAGRAVPEPTLRMLAAAQGKVGDEAAYAVTLRKLAVGTGKVEYWRELIQRVTLQDGFDRKRLALDVYRLRRAVGATLTANETSDMAFLARQAGMPGESKALLEEGFASGLLGKDENAKGDRELLANVTRAAAEDQAAAAGAEAALARAKDGQASFGLGFSLSGSNQHEQALSLMAKAIEKGGLRRPADSQLHLGVAQVRAGRIDDALKSFGAVPSDGGTAELAQLWAAWLKSPARK